MIFGHIKHSPKHEYPEIELGMSQFMAHLSDEDDVRNVRVETTLKTIDCKTEELYRFGRNLFLLRAPGAPCSMQSSPPD